MSCDHNYFVNNDADNEMTLECDKWKCYLEKPITSFYTHIMVKLFKLICFMKFKYAIGQKLY